MLGKLPDAEVAARTGRSANAVRQKREKLGIPNPSGPGCRSRGPDRPQRERRESQAVQAGHPQCPRPAEAYEPLNPRARA
jgi:hypothetical protein